jgi:predicted ATP-grasp superfamily ATP-dependent carboligase
VRSLAARGIPVALVTTSPDDIAQHSRHVADHEPLDDFRADPDRLIELLELRAGQWRGWTLIPSSDETVEIVARHGERLSSSYKLMAPPEEVAVRIMDKRCGMEAARRAGVATPKVHGLADAKSHEREDLEYPLLVKPVISHEFRQEFGGKLFVAGTREEMARFGTMAVEAGTECELVEIVPGPDANVYEYCLYIDRNGEPGPGLTVHKLRQSPQLYGVARVAEVYPEIKELREASIEILRALDYRGAAGVEFKLDPRDGKFRFLEVNGRPVIFNLLLCKAGLDLVAAAWDDLNGGSVRQSQPEGWPGVWINSIAEVLYMAFRKDTPPLGWKEFAAPYRRPKIDAVWSRKDPLPYAAMAAGVAPATMRRTALRRV